jgi:hypothetical protein
VRIAAELMDVVRDLCACAAALSLMRERSRAAALVEQCAELLAHRARLLAKLRSDPSSGGGRFDRGPSLLRGVGWTN